MSDTTNRAALYRKLHAVMAEAERVEKNGTNTAQNYNYVRAEDVIREIRALFITHGLVLMPSVAESTAETHDLGNGKLRYLRRLDIAYTIGDMETGETVTMHFCGEGIDTGDKGFYKAYTGCFKYFLIDTFMLPTGDDPEEDERDAHRPVMRPQSRPSRPPVPAGRPAPEDSEPLPEDPNQPAPRNLQTVKTTAPRVSITPRNDAPQTPAQPATDGIAPRCSVHKSPMRPSKNGGGWYCPNKVDGAWCKAKAEQHAAADVDPDLPF